MKELGVTSHADYKLCMLLDDLAMITVDTPTYGVIEANTHTSCYEPIIWFFIIVVVNLSVCS